MHSSYAYHREVENTYLVRDRDRQLRRHLVRIVLWVLPMLAAVMGYVWLQVQVLDSAYDIGRLERELTEAGRSRSHLALEVARRSSLPSVESRARAELGMVVPEADSTLFWPEVAPAPSAARPVAFAGPVAPAVSAPALSAPALSAPAAAEGSP